MDGRSGRLGESPGKSNSNGHKRMIKKLEGRWVTDRGKKWTCRKHGQDMNLDGERLWKRRKMERER